MRLIWKYPQLIYCQVEVINNFAQNYLHSTLKEGLLEWKWWFLYISNTLQCRHYKIKFRTIGHSRLLLLNWFCCYNFFFQYVFWTLNIVYIHAEKVYFKDNWILKLKLSLRPFVGFCNYKLSMSVKVFSYKKVYFTLLEKYNKFWLLWVYLSRTVDFI